MAHAALSITEELTYSARLGDCTITGLVHASNWEGLTKYTNADGHLIVDAVSARLVAASPTILAQLPAAAPRIDPEVGDIFEGGAYVGLTIVDGQLARLILLPGEARDVTWDEAMAWAKEQDGFLPTRQELITAHENLKSEFDPVWYWSCQQHAAGADCAWGQDFDGGYQSGSLKSYAGRARAFRRLPI